MIIALFGPPGAGKDTVGKILVEQYAYRRVAFADKVRELALKLNPHIFSRDVCLQTVVETYGWEIAKREIREVRFWLERVGDGCREVLGEDVWIKSAFRTVAVTENVVITDLRKFNEIDWLWWYAEHPETKTAVWHITRNGCEKRPFDEWRPEWATATIENNGTIEELTAKVKELMDGLPSRTPSPSQR